MAQRLVVALTAAVCTGLLAIYVITTFLYLTPPNPIKARHFPAILRVEHPFFSQNWHLFAPNPVRTNQILAGRCRTGSQVTEWKDLTTPLVAGHHRNRLSPMGKLARPTQDALHLILGRSLDEWKPLVCRRFPEQETCRNNSGRQKAWELGTLVVQRVVSASCTGIRGVRMVQGRILVHEPPPWSRRYESQDRGRIRYVTLPWMDYVHWR
jgi:hypothetical protein